MIHKLYITILSLFIIAQSSKGEMPYNEIQAHGREIGGIDEAKLTNITYVDHFDFISSSAKFKTINLTPGHSIKYVCGNEALRNQGTVKMYPQNPITQTLDTAVRHQYDESIRNVLNNNDIFRSTNKLVYYFNHIESKNDYYLITYPKDTIITAKNPEEFSINIACEWHKMGPNGYPLFKWLEITFADVYPMPYGCGSVHNHIFVNYLPNTNEVKKEITATECVIRAEPSMIIGLICDENEDVDPPDCFQDVASAKKLEVSQYMDTNFKYMTVNTSFRLFKVPDNSIKDKIIFYCRCVVKSDKETEEREKKETAKISVISIPRYNCNFFHYLRTPGISTTEIELCRGEVHPGGSFYIRSRVDGPIKEYKHYNYESKFFPDIKEEGTALMFAGSNEKFRTIVNVSEYMAFSGFTIESHEYADGSIHMEFTYPENAIVVMKTPTHTLEYEVVIRDSNYKLKAFMGIAYIYIAPSDPYTYGCGAGDNGIFREERSQYTVTKSHTSHGETNVVICKVESQEMTPIGFYCPPNAILDPPDCFNSVFLASTGRVVPLSEVAPYARALSSRNLKILDFVMSKEIKEQEATRAAEVIECKCNTLQGDLLAAIKVGIGQPTDDHGRPRHS
ncbi:bifunctional 6-Cysteine (6-Cys) domain/6-Cysteine (6-Cys) domain superfamily [Babesia duncani]|uniref:Bifunctional 6-Cysteine (6-Cys) domain/6-Cysteine (6-Cys) domain superfamily n=1 Tax=Babesia duncani TaxID=323732 RepID=A0AAD9PIL6_9APIC|nr:bifunctional 6-Cysteine (6-Cys) domain/6-Cysteine (6-Cys) domain superfamily [Babesia duncani]